MWRPGRFEAEKDAPLADAQAQFTGTVFEGLHVAVACRGETYQGRIDPCLDDAIETRQIAHRRGSKNNATDHSPSRRRTSSRGTRAKSSLAAASASSIPLIHPPVW
jgi:hypothetical protein